MSPSGCLALRYVVEMIEILVIIILCKKAGRQLRAKGYNPWPYYIFIVGLWFSVEVASTLVIFKLIYPFVIGTNQNIPFILGYLPVLLLAFGSAYLVVKHVKKKPSLIIYEEKESNAT